VDFWDATKVLFRRWYIALPLLLLTFGATGYTAVAVKPDYVLTSYVQLIPPAPSGELKPITNLPGNPWNQLGLEALSQAANYATVDQTFLDTLQQDGYSTNFKITVGDPVAGATIEVIGSTRRQAIDTTDTVIKRYRDSTQRLQTQYNVQPKDMIQVQRLDQGENLKQPGGKVKRAILAVAGTGLLLMAGATIAVDAFIRRRRNRKANADGMNGFDLDSQPRVANGVRRASVRDFENDTVRIALGTGGERAPAPAPRAQAEDPSNADSLAMPVVTSDETIVLPLTRQWATDDKDGSRR
jgi:hypothetical protein